jgi:long-chain acyl-CoA synthetase
MILNNLAEMFFANREKHPDHPAYRFKKDGKWSAVTWRTAAEDCERTAGGLIALGISHGDRVGLISNNRYEWAITDYAVLAVGAVLVPVYPTLTAPQIAYIIRDSAIRFLIVEDEQQIMKIETIRSGLNTVEKYFVLSPPETVPECWEVFSDLSGNGAALLAEKPDIIRETKQKISRGDLATVVYTSGTTGEPKGAMLTHGNFLSNIESAAQIFDCYPTDSTLSFLPLSHSFERMAGHFFSCFSGATVSYAESLDTVAENIREVRPTLVISVPRLYEKIYNRILTMVEAGSALKRWIFYFAVAIGRKYSHLKLRQQKIPVFTSLEHALANRLVFRKLHERVGGRLRYFVSGGAPLAPEIAEFFAAVGLVILEGYGLTETSPAITFNRPESMKIGTVGKPIPGVEVRIAHDGEILSRGPHIMKGYLNKEADTREVIDEDGWFHTGDIGMFDDEGFLVITDRKKNILVTAGGKNVAPQPIENRLITSPYIEQAMLIGDRRRFCSAIIVPDREALENWAREQSLNFNSYEDLLSLPEVSDLISAENERLTIDFATFEKVKKFVLVPEPFSQDGGELTPTLKVKRRVVEEKFAAEIEAIYTQ